MRDRPPILVFLLLFTAMLAVVTALAALDEALTQAEPSPSGVRTESPPNPLHTNIQAWASGQVSPGA